MATVQLNETWRVLVDDKNHELQELGESEKHGAVWRTVGYYSSLPGAAYRAVTLHAFQRDELLTMQRAFEIYRDVAFSFGVHTDAHVYDQLCARLGKQLTQASAVPSAQAPKAARNPRKA